MAAKIAMIAMTTRSSMSVNALLDRFKVQPPSEQVSLLDRTFD
jgi:hypothetical protein